MARLVTLSGSPVPGAIHEAPKSVDFKKPPGCAGVAFAPA